MISIFNGYPAVVVSPGVFVFTSCYLSYAQCLLSHDTNFWQAAQYNIFTMASGSSTKVLLDFLPKAGFAWSEDQGWPMLLRTRVRDAAVVRALMAVLPGEGLAVRNVGAVLEAAFADLADSVGDLALGAGAEISLLVWLGKRREAGCSELASAITENTW